MFRIKGRDDHLCGLRAARLVKEVSDIRVSDFEKKEHLILRKIMELLGSQDLDEEQLCNVFAALLQPGLNR